MATNKRTYPNSNFAWYNDEDRLAILTQDTTAIGGERTSERYDSFQGDGNLSGTISDADCSGTTITFTTSAAHGLTTGDRVSISGTTNFNDDNLASQSITVASITSFTMTRSTSNSSTDETGTFTSLFIDNGLRITYTAKYGTIDAQTEDLKTEAGLDSGLHPSVVCYIKARMFEDTGDIQKAQYFKALYDKMVKQYPLRKSGVRSLAVPRL
jgi:hypothetical protein